jgi:tripartite-type tricarboxylate transporter receptor subunit TctC
VQKRALKSKEKAVKLARRTFLHLAAGAAALPAVARSARAQAYPSRPVRLIVPFAPGGNTDLFARLIGQWLSERLGQAFVVESRPGAGTNIGTEAAMRAAPDGYTLLMATPAQTINAALYDKLSFNFVRDIAPVAAVVRTPFVMAVHPSVPAMTVSEFIAYATANPGKLSMASSGIGSSPHATGELFKMMAGISMVHVPYRGAAPALTDLIAGQVQIYFTALPEAIEHVRSGKIRALAVTTALRSELLPDTPTVSEVLPGFEASFWAGFGAPKGTPAQLVAELNKEINAGLADPKIRSRLAELGGTVLAGSPSDFGKLIADEAEKWAKVIRSAGIKPE